MIKNILGIWVNGVWCIGIGISRLMGGGGVLIKYFLDLFKFFNMIFLVINNFLVK